MAKTPRVVRAAAVAILPTSSLSDEEREQIGGQRFMLHPHVAEVAPNEPALTTYLADIYDNDTKVALDAPAPTSAEFRALAVKDSVPEATRDVAEALRVAMEPKNANAGIVFGFLLTTEDRGPAYGIIKADLEDQQRFFMDVKVGDEWTISSVRELLPPPQTKYAKYVICPRPVLAGAAGIRDVQAEAGSAASYLLSAIGIILPRSSGTKQAVATAAKRAGYDAIHVRRELSRVSTDSPIDDVIDRSFPDISPESRASLKGQPERPLHTVLADETFATTWFTRSPRFSLTADESVQVQVSGRTVTVTLPEGHDPIDTKYEK